jgi:hypothetical protein
MAFDSARGRIVLFGGEGYGVGGTSQFNDTWEWDGDIWTQVSDIGPSPRQFHAMAYDTKRQRLVLFGSIDLISRIGSPGDVLPGRCVHYARTDSRGDGEGRRNSGVGIAFVDAGTTDWVEQYYRTRFAVLGRQER